MKKALGYTIIDDFRLDGPHGFLSNFYASPYRLRGVPYATVEHHYQAAKTDDPEWQQRILTASNAGNAKKLGRKAPLADDWEQRKIEVMRFALSCKFSETQTLANDLLATGNAILVEGNTWGDRIWGMTRTPSGHWAGSNLLGILLMERRAILQNLR